MRPTPILAGSYQAVVDQRDVLACPLMQQFYQQPAPILGFVTPSWVGGKTVTYNE
jgi:hypothetical protein